MVGWVSYNFKTANVGGYSIIILLFLSINCCTLKEQNSNSGNNSLNHDSSLSIKTKPTVILIDTCPKPQVVFVKPNSLDNANNATAPNIKPADFYLNMPVYNTEQGLPLSTLLCSYCDKQGNMWFGTDGGGVSRYDGLSFKNFSTKEGLTNNHITCIFQDSKNNMWFGTFGGGVSYYNGIKIVNFTTKDGLVSDIVNTLFEDHEQNLWLGCSTGLCKLNNAITSSDNNFKFSKCNMPLSLKDRSVLSIIQDTSETLWIGTHGGIYCETQNEINLKNQIENLRTALVDTTILSLLIDSKGFLWLGTQKGISVVNIAQLMKQKRGNSISSLTINKEESLFSNISYYDTIPITSVRSITEDKRGLLWFGTANGVLYFDGENFKSITTKQGLASNNMQSITVDKQGNLWFSTYGQGANLFTDNSLHFCTTSQGLINDEVTSFTRDKNHNLWIGTNNGISILTPQNLRTKSENNIRHVSPGLINKNVVNNHFNFQNYSFKEGTSGNQIRNIFADQSGNIWVSTSDYGVSKFNSNIDPTKKNKTSFNQLTSIENYTTDNGLLSNNTRAVLEDRVGNFWIVNYGGISKLSTVIKNLKKGNAVVSKTEKKLTNYTATQGIPDKLTYCIAEDHKGNLWFGTQSHGVFCYDGNRVDAINNNNPFKNEDYIGLKKLNGKYTPTFTNYTSANGLGSDCVFRIRADKYGMVWFATYEGGLSRFDATLLEKDEGNLFLNFTTNDGLPDNSIYDFVFDNNDNIVIGTNLGITILKSFTDKSNSLKSEKHTNKVIPSLNNLPNLSLRKSYKPIIESFNKKTGYPIKDILNDAMYCDSENIVWAGCGDNKLACLNLNYISNNLKTPSVNIQNIKLNEEAICWSCLQDKNASTDHENTLIPQLSIYGKTLSQEQKNDLEKKFSNVEFDSVSKYYDLPQNLKLDYKHNNITFDYNAIDPATANIVIYQYMLEGYNKEWNPVTQKTSATFGNISEGTYTFILKSSYPYGVWSEPIRYTFIVLPPWYRNHWAYLTYLLILIAMVWGIIKWRESNYKEKLSFEKRISEVEMNALRSQMNPHFIFNSLHAINKYVLDNDKLKASDYLSKFSKLMRMILENSREQEVTLQKDLEALKLYMQLETLRFQNRFQFIITTSESIDTENTLIAPLLIQPFVENAILHGIREKENGLIKIEITRVGNFLNCIIEDNGIGREHLVATETGESVKRKSLGMKITQERLQIIEQLKQVKTTIEITDLKDSENKPSGLRISLQLPFEEAF